MEREHPSCPSCVCLQGAGRQAVLSGVAESSHDVAEKESPGVATIPGRELDAYPDY